MNNLKGNPVPSDNIPESLKTQIMFWGFSKLTKQSSFRRLKERFLSRSKPGSQRWEEIRYGALSLEVVTLPGPSVLPDCPFAFSRSFSNCD